MKWLKYGGLGLLGLLAVAVAVLLILGQRTGGGIIRAGVEINRPPADVWRWLEDNDKFRQWVSWTVDVKDEGPNGVGGRRTTFMKDPNMNGEIVQVHSELTAYDPHRHMTAKLTSPQLFDGVIRYDLADRGGRTQLDVEFRVTYHHWFARLMEPLVTPQARAKEVADLTTLKRLAEAGTPN